MTIKEVTLFLVCLFSLANCKDVRNVLNKCTAEKPCEVNAGDCTFDNECRGNLICTRNNCEEGSTVSLYAKCCQKPEQPIKVNSGKCKDKKSSKKCKKLKKKKKCKKKKVWKKCLKTCEKCDDSGCPGNQVPNTNKPGECVCPGDLVLDSNNLGECICPGNKIPDDNNPNQCSCPANQIPDSNDPTQCLCPNGQLPNMTRQCDDFCFFEDYFITNCPIQRGDYNGCCLCTQYYYYGCDCCREVVEEIGVGGDCTKWGEPTGDDEFCYMKNN